MRHARTVTGEEVPFTDSSAHLAAGRQVVVDGEGNFGLLPSDQAVGQREVNKEVLEGMKLRPLC